MMSTPSPEFSDQRIRVGERLSSQMILSPEEIATFARLSGDLNPLHHDEAYAQQTRFGGVIVSGPQLISLMMVVNDIQSWQVLPSDVSTCPPI
jgi:acyl dehydratase